MDDFEKELKTGFLEEASELLTEAEQCFLDLESDSANQGTIEKIFRIAHNIKGSSKAVGFDALGAFTHEFESFLLKCKSGSIPILKQTISLMLECNDHIKESLKLLQSDFSATLPSEALVEKIKKFSIEPEAKHPDGFASPTDSSLRNTSDVRTETATSENDEVISTEEVSLLGKTGEENELAPSVLGSTDVVNNSFVEPASPIKPQVQKTAQSANLPDESIRVSLNRLEKLLNFVGEMVILQTVMREQAYGTNPAALRRTIHQIGKVTKELQDVAMGLRMVPVKQTFQKMQRIVRDTSNILKKKVNLIIQGEDTELDKTMLEALGDPLVHLIRNAVDHGIELPEDRVKIGKNEVGTVLLHAYHQSGKLVIDIQDDGGGIPADKLREKAREKGILPQGKVISDQEAVMLIFHPGFSTKAQVTEVSGRGVGMDVVRSNIEKVSGEIIVETKLGEGSRFKIILPLTLAIIDGMIIRSREERYVIPLVHVHESMKVNPKDLRQASGIGEILLLRGESLPVLRLTNFLKMRKTPSTKNIEEEIAIIIRVTGRPFAVLVDDIIGQHQVVIKKLGAEMSGQKGISGSAILGDGKPALILELPELAPNTPYQTQSEPGRML